MPCARAFFVGVAAAVVLVGVPRASQATTIPFSAMFSADNDVLLVPFTVGVQTHVRLQTTSYAGGGFDPLLTLFDATGTRVGENDDRDFFADLLDSFLQLTLDIGLYTLAVTQSPNVSVSNQLADGFQFDATPSFTFALYGTQTTPCAEFVDFFGNCRAPDVAGLITIDIDAVPEPSTILLLLAAAGTLTRRGLRGEAPPA